MKKEALLYERLEHRKVHCFLCAHNCQIENEKFGFCGVRKNEDGVLYSYVYGEIIASGVDPIEKKPLYHFFPGESSYSIATAGCNFKCGFCQNWQISQASIGKSSIDTIKMLPEDIVDKARESGAKSIAYTYTEPTVFFEYAYDIAKIAKDAGLYNVFVTNGYMSRKAIEMIAPFLDAANIDLKSFREDFYIKNCKAHLEPVLNAIRVMRENNIWIELTTLIIPGENDSKQELVDIAEFIAGVGKDIPWHISRFHPDFQFSGYDETSIEVLKKAEQIGKKAGLQYVYLGNILENSNTYCYKCGELLIERMCFDIKKNKIDNGKCFACGTLMDGVFVE
ncbi:MAG: AmmeMemoRadiSam system radical SAM enzyme [Candidatus Saelkia tenebricola]|nr:AmmeMemoRadiSam system radical SAM enzyme [Candidatus Saelkia tenebricola]